MMAPSKTFNLAGMATSSVIISDPDLREKYQKKLNQAHVGMGNLFGMVASEAAYTYGEDWLNQLLEYVKGNLDFMEDYLKKHIPQVKLIRPEGTYLVWLDFRELGLGSKKLKSFIQDKAKLGLSDGTVFGPGGKGFQRMNIACPRSIVQEAMKRLTEAVKSLS